jgi:hypothetical protein
VPVEAGEQVLHRAGEAPDARGTARPVLGLDPSIVLASGALSLKPSPRKRMKLSWSWIMNSA